MSKIARYGLIVGMGAALAVVVGCGKTESTAGGSSSSGRAVAEPAKAEQTASVASVKVSDIEIALPLVEGSAEVRDVAEGRKAYTKRYGFSGESSSVKPAINSALAAAGYRISEVAGVDGEVKYVGRTDTKRISVVVYPRDEASNTSRISVFWEE